MHVRCASHSSTCSTHQHVLSAAWARARHGEAQRLCMDPASRWVKSSSERGKEAANYISLFEVAAMGRLRALWERGGGGGGGPDWGWEPEGGPPVTGRPALGLEGVSKCTDSYLFGSCCRGRSSVFAGGLLAFAFCSHCRDGALGNHHSTVVLCSCVYGP